MAHEAVSEAAVVGYPHDIKGQGILRTAGKEPSEALRKELVAWSKDIGPIASPDLILIRTRAAEDPLGKIMRRIPPAQDCRGRTGQPRRYFDPGGSAVVDDLAAHRQNKKGAEA